jgi:epoxyqueuosine reductase
MLRRSNSRTCSQVYKVSSRRVVDTEAIAHHTQLMHDYASLLEQIRHWSRELGFQALGVSTVELGKDAAFLQDWLHKQYHGDMHYMADHGSKRYRPEELVPGTLRVISVRMDYASGDDEFAWKTLQTPEHAYVARYALGRDYHKVLRQRLQKLSDHIQQRIGAFGYRVFVDSAPVLERALARNAGLGWIGKNTCLIDKDTGSWFFLGEILVDIPLPISEPASAHCGTCVRCIEVCPTKAILAPNVLDARRCISYLTIELKGSIPEEFRRPIGNRIFGCDDCQLICPWNKFAKKHDEPDFRARNNLDKASLAELFAWSEEEFMQRTEGSAIRRTGYIGWLRNIAIALGNASTSSDVISALRSRATHESEIVREHAAWALEQHHIL